MRERDLFRAIVLSGASLVAAPGCSSTPAPVDASNVNDAPGGEDAPVAADAPSPIDTGTVVADASTDAPAANDAPVAQDAGEDAMVLIL